MKAMTCQKGQLSLEDYPYPKPSKGQALIEVDRCGICGAHVVIDPAVHSPFKNWQEFGFTIGMQQSMMTGIEARIKSSSTLVLFESPILKALFPFLKYNLK